jgi:hypothetical protein
MICKPYAEELFAISRMQYHFCPNKQKVLTLKSQKMKKRVLLFAVVMLITTLAFSQTKRIALYSHSGTDAEFNVEGEGNFGGPPPQYEKLNYNKTWGDTVNLTQKQKSNATPAPAKADTVATKGTAKPQNKKKPKPANSQK